MKVCAKFGKNRTYNAAAKRLQTRCMSIRMFLTIIVSYTGWFITNVE